MLGTKLNANVRAFCAVLRYYVILNLCIYIDDLLHIV